MVNEQENSVQDEADITPDVAVKAHSAAHSAAQDVDQGENEDMVIEAIPDDPIAALKAEVEKNLDGWQRTLAEFQNYKRRVNREQQELRKRVALETLADVLAIVDDFERALANIPEDLQGNAWVDGVALIQAKFKKLMDDYDIEIIDPVGQEFDPNRHQAIGTGESEEHDSGHVIETLQKGYLSGSILLRPALVYVAS